MIFIFTNNHHKPFPPGRPPSPREIIIERLKFDENQIEKYEELIDSHRNEIINIEHSLKAAKEKLYLTLLSENENEKDELIAQINILQRKIEIAHYEHFKAIKNICKPEQINFFNDLTNDLAFIFSPFKKPPRR